jgi:hypothetical protein
VARPWRFQFVHDGKSQRENNTVVFLVSGMKEQNLRVKLALALGPVGVQNPVTSILVVCGEGGHGGTRCVCAVGGWPGDGRLIVVDMRTVERISLRCVS